MKNLTSLTGFRLFMCLLTTLSALTGQAQNHAKKLLASNGDSINFLEYKPSAHDIAGNTRKYPLIIFLHGIGQRSNTDNKVWNIQNFGIAKEIAQGNPMKFTWNGKTDTFMVLSPMCPISRPGDPDIGVWPDAYILSMINYAKTNLKVDTNRIFLTGLSFGGGGTLRFLSLAASNAKKLAAAASVCAPWHYNMFDAPSPNFENNVRDAKLPFWGFHAEDDPTIGAEPRATITAVDHINSVNPPVKALLTLWPDGRHEIWPRVYNSIAKGGYDGIVNIYEWFLGQGKNLPVNQLPVAHAGSDFSIYATPGTATLNASTSTDDGTLVRYIWKKYSAPNGVNLSSINISDDFGPSNQTAVSGLNTIGQYKFELIVVDDRASFDRDTIVITVNAGSASGNIPPIARAGNDTTITLPVDSVKVSSSASTDADGTIAGRYWTYISGPSSYTFSNAYVASPTISDLQAGTYYFRIQIRDNLNAYDWDTIKISVLAGNIPPVARAGNDTAITLPVDSVKVNCSASTDADGTIAGRYWTYVSGPSAYTISNPYIPSPTIRDLEEGTYRFRIQIRDNLNAYGWDTITITVLSSNIPPVARAGNDTTITLPVDSVKVSCSASTDADGTIAGRYWTYISGPSSYTFSNPYVASPMISDLQAGTYYFRIQIRDNLNAYDWDTIKITVNPANIPPVARAGNDTTITLPMDSVKVNCSASTDADGTIAGRYWTYVSGPSSYTFSNPYVPSPMISDLVEGVYQFRIQIRDNLNAYGWDTLKITVLPVPNIPPVARAGNDTTIRLPVDSVRVNCSASTDADGTIAGRYWTYVSGPSSYTFSNPYVPSPMISDLVVGVYQFRIQIRDNLNAYGWDTIKITVNPANIPPVARAGNDTTITLPMDSVKVNCSASTDADGTIAGRYWTYVSGPSSYTFSNPYVPSPMISDLVEGVYQFRIQIRDNLNAYGWDTIKITVNPEGGILAFGSGITDIETDSELSFTGHPNPAHTMLNVRLANKETGHLSIGVYDMNGALIRKEASKKTATVFQKSVNISGLAMGVYYIQVTVNGKRHTMKFIKK